ncbi:MAG: hypothetical protein GXP55_04760 [Deltaproteobacteria bacterium]|nr:hypothetical protein [Deltaproteobacteria bacterium]
MPTFDEVREYAKSRYEFSEDSAERFSLVFEYESGRMQKVVISRFEAMDREWCDFASACCSREQLSPEDAVRKNWDFAVGALALEGDTYVIRYSLSLATMNLAEFELPLHVVARTADTLERELTGGDKF